MQSIHLAGTNGKGSTAKYLANILWQKHSCGLFTSPHMISPTERFMLNGNQISEGAYETYMQAASDHQNEKDVWTQFGIWYIAAKNWFTDMHADYAVIETGLGGRMDPTNEIQSIMQIITPISLDHTQHLGDSIIKIAHEKCGIIKWGSTVITHPQHPDALDVIRRTCERLDATLIELDADAIRLHEATTEGQVFSYRYKDMHLDHVHTSSIATVQLQNACVAAIAAYELGITSTNIATGISDTVLTARTQLTGNVLVDVSHNESAVTELVHTVEKYFSSKYIVVLTALMRDKNARMMAEKIESFANVVLCTRADKQRGLPPEEYVRFFDNAQAMQNPAYAFDYAKNLANQKKGMVVVCGTFYILPDILENI